MSADLGGLVDDEIPNVLSHYTSARGLMGILSARQYSAGKGLQPSVRLWATDSQYLNDSHEVLWGAAGIIKAAEDAPGEADGRSSPWRTEFSRGTPKVIEYS